MRHLRPSLTRFASCGFAVAVAALVHAAGPPSERPCGTKPPAASVPEDTLQVFRHKDFGGDLNQLSDVTGKQSWQDHEFLGAAENKASSLRWNLPRGVLVTLFENTESLGRQISVWGTGELDVRSWKLNDKFSSWSWNYVGGANAPAQRVKDGRTQRPRYAREVGGVSPDSVQLFKERGCKGRMAAIDRLTSQPAGVFTAVPEALGKRASSARWNLPEGVVVVLASHPNGEGPQVAFWGSGEFEAFVHWGMNDKVTHWAWYDIGDAPAAAE